MSCLCYTCICMLCGRRESSGGKGAHASIECTERRGAPGRADNWRVLVHLSRQPQCQLHGFLCPRTAQCCLQHGQLAPQVGHEVGPGRFAVPPLQQTFTNQPELGSGWESLHKRSKGGFRGGFAFMNPPLLLPWTDLFVQAWLPPATHY